LVADEQSPYFSKAKYLNDFTGMYS